MRELTIAGQRIADDTECFVIAEVSHNHQGSAEIASEMFRVAKECGAQAVKLQKRSTTSLFTRHVYEAAPGSKYGPMRDYASLRAKRELSKDAYHELRQYAHSLGLAFIVTAFDFESLDFLMEVGVDAIKIASGDIRNTPLLQRVAQQSIPLVVSTGGASMQDVERAYITLKRETPHFSLLQCTSSYPTADENLNLRVIESYRERFPDTVIGLSSHQLENRMEPVAYALGARIVEKHFTLSRLLGIGDHAISLEPPMLKQLVDAIRAVKVALGDKRKSELPSEATGVLRLGKKLVAARPLPAGYILDRDDIDVKAPGDGVAPCQIDELIGRETVKPHEKDDDLTFETTRISDAR